MISILGLSLLNISAHIREKRDDTAEVYITNCFCPYVVFLLNYFLLIFIFVLCVLFACFAF